MGIRAQSIEYRRHERTVLDRVDIDLADGEVTAIVGPNGAGKSVLLRVLSGDLTPHDGTVTRSGLVASTFGARDAELVLSGAAVRDARTVLVDEATTGLDAGAAHRVASYARELAQGPRAVALVMHDLTLAAQVADRIVLLAAGRVIAAGPPAAVLRRPLLTLAFGVPLQVVGVAGASGPVVVSPPVTTTDPVDRVSLRTQPQLRLVSGGL